MPSNPYREYDRHAQRQPIRRTSIYGISPDTVGGDGYESYRQAFRALPFSDIITEHEIDSLRQAARLFGEVRGLGRLADQLKNATDTLAIAAQNVQSLIDQIEDLDEG